MKMAAGSYLFNVSVPISIIQVEISKKCIYGKYEAVSNDIKYRQVKK